MQPGAVNDGAQTDGGFWQGIGDRGLHDLLAGPTPVTVYEMLDDARFNDGKFFGEAYPSFAGRRQGIAASGAGGQGMLFGLVDFAGGRAVNAAAFELFLFWL